MKQNCNRPAELLLGLGLGLGFLTSLRFFGPVGVPEIFVALGLFFLIWKRPRGVFHSRSLIERALKTYLLASIVLILPIVTLLIQLEGSYTNSSSPEYILSFILGIGLSYWLQDAISANAIDMKRLTFWFATAFLLANFFALYIFKYDLGIGDESRYTGGAKNPNQLTFYAATLSLYLVLFNARLAFLLIPIVIMIVLATRSDAYLLGMALVIVSYVFFKLVFSLRLPFRFRFTLAFSVVALCVALTFAFFSNTLAEMWLLADEGDSRTNLMRNAFLASFYSPLVGFGAGSFSGFVSPFLGSEAHNTFLDLSMQFGFIFPIVIYGIMIVALVKLLKLRKFLIAAFVVGFIESGLFHFSARHFTFWAELAIFMNYVFMKRPAFNRRRRLQTN